MGEAITWQFRQVDGVRLVWMNGANMVPVVAETIGLPPDVDVAARRELGRASYLTRAMIRATLEEGLRRIKEADDAAQRDTGT